MTYLLEQEKERAKAKNDIMNWLKGSKKFFEDEINRIEKLVDKYGHCSYSVGYSYAEFDAAERGDV